MHGRQASNERLYLKRNSGGQSLKCLTGMYKETKVIIACYMAMSENRDVSKGIRTDT